MLRQTFFRYVHFFYDFLTFNEVFFFGLQNVSILSYPVIGDEGFVLARRSGETPAPVYYSLRSTRSASVFSFLAAGNSVRGAHSASLASAYQFGIQCYALRAVNTASHGDILLYFCRSPMFPAPARVHRRICSLKRGYEAPSLCLSVKMYYSLRSPRCASVFSFRVRGAGTRKRASVAPRLRLNQLAFVLGFRISGIVALTKRVRT
ncbi:MAG: hypothetical protein H9535_03585 [Ignavibacteria bacterium]|nr:hypothetical protein [Ignavibacteria bacterium]